MKQLIAIVVTFTLLVVYLQSQICTLKKSVGTFQEHVIAGLEEEEGIRSNLLIDPYHYSYPVAIDYNAITASCAIPVEENHIDMEVTFPENPTLELIYDPNTKVLSSNLSPQDTVRLMYLGFGSIDNFSSYVRVPDYNEPITVEFEGKNE